MIPFLHLGPFTIPTFGLMVATGLLVAAYILQADFDRRRAQLQKSGALKPEKGQAHHDEGFLIIGVAGLAGLVGAKLYHVLQNPPTWRSELISRYGFAWFGGFLCGFLTLVFLAKHYRIPVLEFMDLCSPAAAVGYAVGRIGCLLSGDGDYGVPTTLPWGMSFPNGTVSSTEKCVEWGLPPDCRVHPTPIYEFLIWLGIAVVLWQMGKKTLARAGPKGAIFSSYLVLTGIARFLIEFIRINPRLALRQGHLHFIDYTPLPSHSWFSFSDAQTASLVSVVAGIVLLLRIKSTSNEGSRSA